MKKMKRLKTETAYISLDDVKEGDIVGLNEGTPRATLGVVKSRDILVLEVNGLLYPLKEKEGDGEADVGALIRDGYVPTGVYPAKKGIKE